MNKFLKKTISVIAAVAVSAATLLGTPLSEFKGLAAEVSAAEVNEAYVWDRIASLKTKFPQGSYFTVDGKRCCSADYCVSYHDRCKLGSILSQNSNAKDVSASVFSQTNRYSCWAFASYAFAYIFGVDPLNTNYVTATGYNVSESESLLTKLKPGDLVQYYGNGSHYAIFLYYDAATKKAHFYESNKYGNCLVSYDSSRAWNWELVNRSRSKMTVWHFNGYGGDTTPIPQGEHYIVDKNYSGSDPKNIRASKSTGSALLGTIPKNTVCWLTEISGSGSNKWGKVTYNGVTGYINLYYSVTTDDHQWSGWTVSEAAACTDPGTEKRSCGCGKIEEKTIAATGHNYGAWQTVTGATCTEDGAEQHTCSKCGNKETHAIAAAGHSYKDVVTAPTCTKEGYTTHTCTKCNNSYTDNKTAATGHSYKDVVTAPTCTEEGYTTHTCTKCGSSYTDTKTAATGHSYKEEIVAPTPTAGGYVKHTCTKCGQSYNDSYTSVLADVNNDKSVNAIDAKWILQYVSGSRSFTAGQMTVADVNGDGQVNAVDAKWILQIASGSRKLAGDAPKAIHNKARVFVTNL